MADISSSSLPLPLELMDTILEYLNDDGDTATLRNFCLVNQYFAHACRKHLFSKVRIVQKMDYEKDIPLVEHPIRSFKRLLSSNPILGSYVRDFELETMVAHDDPNDIVPPDELDRVTNFTFGFSEGNRYSPGSRLWSTIPSIRLFLDRNQITKLGLFGIENIPLPFLQSLQHLKYLDIMSCSVLFGAEGEQHDPTIPSISLEGLAILDEVDPITKKGFLSSSAFDISRLSKLHYYAPEDNPESLEYIGEMISRIDGLQDLQIEFEEFTNLSIRNMIVPHLTASSRKSLRIISVIMYKHITNPVMDNHCLISDFEEELKQLSISNSLEEISFSVTVGRYDTPEGGWETLFTHEHAFEDGFPKLRKLNLAIGVGIYSSDEKFVEDTRNSVPRCLDQTLLWARNHPRVVATGTVSVDQV